MDTTTAPAATPGAPDAPAAGDDPPPTSRLVESLLDNLPVWTVVAAAIAFLYLVWLTVELLTSYVGPLPKVVP